MSCGESCGRGVRGDGVRGRWMERRRNDDARLSANANARAYVPRCRAQRLIRRLGAQKHVNIFLHVAHVGVVSLRHGFIRAFTRLGGCARGHAERKVERRLVRARRRRRRRRRGGRRRGARVKSLTTTRPRPWRPVHAPHTTRQRGGIHTRQWRHCATRCDAAVAFDARRGATRRSRRRHRRW